MSTLSVSVPDLLRQRMDLLDEINWSAVARNAFEEKVKEIEFVKMLVAKSKLNQNDAQEIGRKINESMAKKFRDLKCK